MFFYYNKNMVDKVWDMSNVETLKLGMFMQNINCIFRLGCINTQIIEDGDVCAGFKTQRKPPSTDLT